MDEMKKMVEDAIKKNPDSLFVKAFGKFSRKELSILFSEDFKKKMANPKDFPKFSGKEKRIFLLLMKACIDDAKRLAIEKELSGQNNDPN